MINTQSMVKSIASGRSSFVRIILIEIRIDHPLIILKNPSLILVIGIAVLIVRIVRIRIVALIVRICLSIRVALIVRVVA